MLELSAMLLQTDTRTYFELQPVVPMGMPWQICVAVIVFVLLIGWTLWLHRKDNVDLNRPAATLLTALRMIAIGALILFVLNLGRRSETRLTKESRLVFLIDDSLSMGLADRKESATSAEASSPQIPQPRISDVTRLLGEDATDQLRKSHTLAMYSFSELDQPTLLAELPKLRPSEPALQETSLRAADEASKNSSRSLIVASIGIAIGVLALVLIISHFFRPTPAREESAPEPSAFGSWRFTAGALALVFSVFVLGVADLVAPRVGLLQVMGISPVETSESVAAPTAAEAIQNAATSSAVPDQSKDWTEAIVPRGTSTRIGSALQYVVNKEQGGPIAGVCLLSDGQSNAGMSIDRATAAASNAGIPIYTIGIGSPNQPKNVMITELQAPSRVFPGDNFLLKTLIKSFGLEGRTARVQLLSVDEQESEAEILEDEQSVRLLADGTPADVEFNVTREEEGKRRYEVRVESFEEDLDLRDNSRRCVIEVVKQKTTVLLIAGGPTREFRFLRNQLFRDEEIFLNVWLQSALEGADQESDVLLTSFPETMEELYQIDCIIAFDPDWRQLSLSQTQLLENWIAGQAGGLINVAGPVNTPQWTRQPRGAEQIDIIRRIYPVSFYNQGSAVLKLGRFGGTSPFPLNFSRAGRSADYLWIGDSAGISQETWAQFEGVFGYYAVNDPKPGADVLANFGDPETAIDGSFPIYLASHFYGAGRVFFQASGEMWRVRRLNVNYFQQYYTKLIRWASQGRLNRDSTRGVLLTDRERCWMGDTIVVQAILKNAQDEPLAYPQVEALVKMPSGLSQPLTLRSNPAAASPGSFTGTFVAGEEGEFRFSLPVPESPEQDVLTLSVMATIPDLEKEKPQRNDAVLTKIAKNTGGECLLDTDAAVGSPNHPLSTLELIPPQDQETIIAGTFDRFFKRQLMIWTLALITLCLTMEWTLRRLQKLA